MKPTPFILIILLLASLFLSACGSFAPLTPTAPPPTATAIPTIPPVVIPTSQPTALPTTEPTVAPTIAPTAAPTAEPTVEPTIQPTATLAATPAPGATQVSAKDGMQLVFVPAGDFTMGSSTGTVDEQPVHNVTLAAFWIDQTEVTNGMYSQCVQTGACLPPSKNGSNTHASYYPNSKYANYPVIDLKWSSADAYCTWAGRRLPTEAEWEKAAHGTDARIYPWGNQLPNNTLLNFNTPAGDAVRVGSYMHGASPYGVLDLAGNVREWVADWYDANYYAASPASDPLGPAAGEFKVVRGGSWHTDLYLVTSANRQYLAPDTCDISVGFRCAQAQP